MLHFFASNLTTSTKIISIFVFADCYITDYLKLYCIRNSFFKKLGSRFRYFYRFSPEIADKIQYAYCPERYEVHWKTKKSLHKQKYERVSVRKLTTQQVDNERTTADGHSHNS